MLRNESEKMRPGILLLVLMVSVMIAGAYMSLPAVSMAQTGLATTADEKDLPTNYVSLQRFDLKDADSFTSTNPKVQLTDQWVHAATGHTPPVYTFAKALYYKGPLNWGTANRTKTADAKLKPNSIPGEFTFRWNNIARLTDNRTADLQLVLSDWVYNVGAQPESVKNADRDMYVLLAGNNLGTNIVDCPPRKGFLNTDAVEVSTTTSVKMTFRVLEHGTDTPIDAQKYPTMLFGVVDLDQQDYSIAGEKSDAQKYAGKYSEGVGLLSGFLSPIWLTAGTLERIDTVDGCQKIRGTVEDSTNTLVSGFAAGVAPQEFSFIWYGSSTVNHASVGEDGAPAGRGIGTKFQPYSEIVTDTVKVSYEWNGAHPNRQVPAGAEMEIGSSYDVDTSYKPGDTVEEDGKTWTFQGWDKSGTITVNEDTVIRGAWQYDDKYTVTYEWDGDHPDRKVPAGQTEIPSGSDYAVDTSYAPGDTVTDEEGTWTFLGWDRTGTIKVTSDIVIRGKWALEPFHEITTEVINGTITEHQKKIPQGEDRNISYAPDPGCQFGSITVDGEAVSTEEHPQDYTFSAIKKNHHIRVVYEKMPQLAVVKTSDREVYNAGDTVTYTVTVKQTAADAEARDVIVTDALQEGLTLVPDSIAGKGIEVTDQQAQSYELHIPVLKDEITYTYQAVTREDLDAEELVNTVEAAAGNAPDPVRDTAKVRSLTPKPQIEKEVSNETPEQGEEITYTITVKEPQDGITLKNAVVTDALPAGVRLASDGIAVTGDPATVETAGNQLTVRIPLLTDMTVIRFRATVEAAQGSVDNIAVLTGDGIRELEDHARITVKKPEPALTKTVSAEKVAPGDTVTYTLTAGSAVPLKQAVIRDTPPEGVTILPDTVKCSAADASVKVEGNTLTAVFQRLAENVTITYDARIDAAGDLTNTAALTADNFPDGPLQDHATVISVQRDIPVTPENTERTDKVLKTVKTKTVKTVKQDKTKRYYDSPKTGDGTHLAAAVCIMLLAAAAASLLLRRRRQAGGERGRR